MSFAELRKKSNLEALVKKAETKSGGFDKDERFWNPEQDKKTGLGSATIRFLPTPPENDAPWVKLHNHGFKNEETGKWFIEECPSTINEPCFVCSEIQPYWSGSEAEKNIARNRKRKTGYVANVLVIKDPANPENEGNVVLFKFGKQIFDKIMEQIKPEFEEDEAMNPFCFWEGMDFRLRIHKNDGGFRSYDKSAFDKQSALYGGDDAKLEELWGKEHDLRPFLDPKNFKSADELKSKYEQVVSGVQKGASSAANRVLEELEGKSSDAPKPKSEDAKKPAASRPELDLPEESGDAGGASDDWESLLNDL